MGEAVLDVEKRYIEKPKVKRLELEYKDMNYIIINLVEKVIDVNGELYEVSINDEEEKTINKMIWDFELIDEYDYWSDKTGDSDISSLLWRISWIDEYDTYYHKSGALKYPDSYMKLVNELKSLGRI